MPNLQLGAVGLRALEPVEDEGKDPNVATEGEGDITESLGSLLVPILLFTAARNSGYGEQPGTPECQVMVTKNHSKHLNRKNLVLPHGPPC